MNKLIDILVQELPKRGGWPEDAFLVVQDGDGEITFSRKGTPYFGGEVAWHHREGGYWSSAASFFYTELAEDYTTSIVSKQDYIKALGETK